MSQLIEIAIKELGTKEVAGTENNNRIIQYAKEAGFETVENDEQAWCSYFMNWVTAKAGLIKSNRGMARSWLKVGKKTTSPKPGDVVVLWRGSKGSIYGHVGIFLGFSKNGKKTFVLGGNQGDAVSIHAYPKSQVLGFRKLQPDGPMEVPNYTLQIGDQGVGVRKLQAALQYAYYYAELPNGQFDELTEEAVKQLQWSRGVEDPNGIFTPTTRSYLMDLLADLV